MPNLKLVTPKKHLILDAYQDFLLDRQAKLRSEKTLENYRYTVGSFVDWLEVSDPSDLKRNHARAYLAAVATRGVKDTTVHTHARGVRAFLNFLYEEGYIEKPISVPMPSVSKKRLPLLDADQLQKVISKGCRTTRDKALVMLMVDSGLRRAETVKLTWGDIDIPTGLVKVREGKGSKDRSVVVGVRTRRTLLKFRREVPHDHKDSVFGLKAQGVRMALQRIGERAGIHLTAHMLRRTFATLSLRAGLNPLHLQALMGHASLEMTRKYISMIDDDLLAAHQAHGPIDRFLR